MSNARVETGVDSLIELLKDGEKHFLDEVAKELKISLDVLQLWVDFLVEEKVISIEYSFTKPFIFINKVNKLNVVREEELSLAYFKDEFKNSAKEKKISEDQIDLFWKQRLLTELEKLKEFFTRESQKRELKDINSLWEEYKNKLGKLS